MPALDRKMFAERAEKARVLAASQKDPAARTALIELAESYHALVGEADRAEAAKNLTRQGSSDAPA